MISITFNLISLRITVSRSQAQTTLPSNESKDSPEVSQEKEHTHHLTPVSIFINTTGEESSASDMSGGDLHGAEAEMPLDAKAIV